MKILASIVNLFLFFSIVMSGTLFVLNKTTETKYLNETAEKSGIHKGISEVVSRRLVETGAKNSGVPIDQIPPEASNIVSEEYISAKSKEVTAQIEEALRGERATIVIDISDLAAEAEEAGLNINATDLKPVEIAVPGQSEEANIRAAQNINFLKFISYIITAALLIASVTLAIVRRSLAGLGSAFLSSGLAFTTFALMGILLTEATIALIKLPETASEVTPYAAIFTRTLIDSAIKIYVILAILLLLLGIVLLLCNKRLKQQSAPEIQEFSKNTKQV